MHFSRVPHRSGLLAGVCLAAGLILTGCGDVTSRTAAESLARAAELRAAGDPRAALLELKNAAQAEPGAAEVRASLARFYLDMGDGVAAENEITQAYELGYDIAAIDEMDAKALILRGETDKAIEFLERDALWKTSARLTALYADALIQHGDPVKARIYYEDALERDPELVEALMVMARVHGASLELDEAKDKLARAAAADPHNQDVRLLQAELALVDGDPERALTTFREALPLNPYSAAATLGMVRANLALDRYDAANTVLDGAERRFPGHLGLLYYRGVLDYQAKKHESAIDAFRKVMSAIPSHAGSQYYLGSIMLEQGQFEQARDFLQTFLRQFPDSLPVRKLLAGAELKRGNATAAFELLDIPNDDDAGLLQLRGAALNAMGRVDEGIAEMKRAAALAGDDKMLKTSLIMAQIGSGRTDELIPALEEDVRAGGDTAGESALWLMFTYVNQERWDEAIAFAASLPEDKRADPVVLNTLGMAHMGKQDTESARKVFGEALQLAPQSTVVRRNLATLEMTLGNLDAASAHVEEVLKQSPEDPGALTLAARLANGRGDAEKALAMLEKARSTAPNDADSRIMLAAMYLKRGDAAPAIAVAREALALRSGEVTALLTLAEAFALSGDLQEADKAATLATVNAPGLLLPLLSSGAIKLRLGKLDAAARVYTRILELYPGNADAAAGLAYVATTSVSGDAEAAISRLAEIEGESGRVRALRGDVAVSTGDYRAAAAHYGAAFAASGDKATAIKFHYSQMRSGDLGTAIAGLERVLTDHPGDLAVLVTLGPMYEAAGQQDKAVAAYERIIAGDPKSVLALNNLALLKHQAGATDAEQLAARAYELAPEDPQVLDTYGWILATRGKNEFATQLLARAVGSSKGLAPAARLSMRYHYAVSLARFGDRTGAVRELRTALDSDAPFAERKAAEELLGSLAP